MWLSPLLPPARRQMLREERWLSYQARLCRLSVGTRRQGQPRLAADGLSPRTSATPASLPKQPAGPCSH